MKTLIIKDLSRTDALDGKAMAAISGGMYKGAAPVWLQKYDLSKHSTSFSAEQLIGQSQETVVNNGNNVAFAHGITANVKPTQTADNTINFG